MTVEQVWAWGEGKNEYCSPVTGLCEYQKDKDSIVAYFSTASEGGFADWATGTLFTKMNPFITEFSWGATEPDVIIKLRHSMGYQAFPFDVQKAFDPQK